MKRFKSAGQAQRFLAAHDGINNLFLLRRYQVSATQYRAGRGSKRAVYGLHRKWPEPRQPRDSTLRV